MMFNYLVFNLLIVDTKVSCEWRDFESHSLKTLVELLKSSELDLVNMHSKQEHAQETLFSYSVYIFFNGPHLTTQKFFITL